MKYLAALIVLGAVAAPAVTAPQHACVRMTSHGASATCIAATDGRSWLLGCAHAFEGADARKPITIETNSPTPGQQQQVSIRLLAVDYRADLSLCEVNTRLPYVCQVAPAGYRPGRLWSCGYDHMKWPITVRTATSLGSDHDITYTRERPIPGRSGGPLLDPDQRLLYGVVVGFEVHPGGRGMYVSHNKILTFLARNQALVQSPPAQLLQQYQQAPVQQYYQPAPQQVQVPIPQPGVPQYGRPWVSEQHTPPSRQIKQQCPT